MKKWSWVLFGGTCVLTLLTFSSSCVKIAAAGAVSTEHANGFEDSDTEAVVIDATDDQDRQQGASERQNEDLPRSPLGGSGRNGKQFFHYLRLYANTYMLSDISTENENKVAALPTSAIDSTCITNQGQKGNCEQFDKCFPLLNLPINSSGNETESYSNLLDDLYEISVDKKCSSIVHAGSSTRSNVCCDLPIQQMAKPVAQFYNTPENGEKENDNDDLMNSTMPVVPKYTKIVNTWATCGKKQFDIKIIGGQESIPHEYPWMVSLWGKSGKHICGASLIDNNFVLTAAHCIARYTSQDVGKIRLLIGDHNIHSTIDGHHEVRHVSRIIKHKRFSLQTFTNDIALLKLDRPVAYSDRIRPICLPTGSQRADNDEHLIVAGWGQTAYKGTSSSVLRKVVVPVVNNSQCGTHYNTISPVGITNDMICAGGIGVDSCIGDSGGPLIQLVSNRYEQIGIVSFGRECGTYPGVYTKVFSFLNWINVNRNKYE